MAHVDSQHHEHDAAAEYVLGTLDAAERQAFEARLANDAALAGEVAAWERRLSPLTAETQAVAPPAHVFLAILNKVGSGDRDNVVRFKRRVVFWRGVAVAASALAAALTLFIAVPGDWAPAKPGLYVAVLQASDKTPAFIAAVDMKRQMVVVRRMAAPAPNEHSYELWALGAGRAAPEPLGVIDAVAHIPMQRMGPITADKAGATIFAVSLEPHGGSPTGQPTGPVLFTGKLLPAN